MKNRCGAKFSIIVAAEGAREIEGREVYVSEGDRVNAPRLGGIGHRVAEEVSARTGKESRCVVLGHLQRGGSPNAFDRMLASSFGAAAVHAAVHGDFGKMVALRSGDIVTVPIEDAIAALKTVPPDSSLVRTARDLGISFGAADEAKYHSPQEC